jgi:hypothetical protein
MTKPIIFVDSREKPKAIKTILWDFEDAGYLARSTKLYVGDYQLPSNPLLVVDRKQYIAEVAGNIAQGHKRFKAELERAKECGTTVVMLIEQDKIKDRPIAALEDLMVWHGKYTEITGERIYRVLRSWMAKYRMEVEFCAKENTGKEIIRILEEGR